MKNKVAIGAKRFLTALEETSETEGPKKDRALMIYSLYRLIQFIAMRPSWLRRVFREANDLAVYEVVFGNKSVRVMLSKSVGNQAIENRRDNQGALQYVWNQAYAEVEHDPDTYPGVKIPPLHTWRNLNRDGDYVVGILFVRDAYPHERKMVPTNPLRDFFAEYFGALTGR